MLNNAQDHKKRFFDVVGISETWIKIFLQYESPDLVNKVTLYMDNLIVKF